MRHVLTALALLASVTATAAPIKALKADYGCTDKALRQRLETIYQTGDSKAFVSLLAAGVSVGRCDALHKGDIIYVEDQDIWGGMALVRKQGKTASLWTGLTVTKEIKQ